MKEYKEHAATETNVLADNVFDAAVNLVQQGKDIYLQISLKKNWLNQKRKLVTTETLTKAIVPGLSFENSHGSMLRIDTDYLGKKRNVVNPSPGPFEINGSGKQKIKVW